MNAANSGGGPLITVVIPCFNANRTLGLQLDALAHQVEAPPFEVIVVDNRSSEPPDDVVAAWTDRIVNLRIVRATEAQGISCARNVGVREARTNRIILCDADDCAGPTFVRAAYEGLNEVPLVTGNVQLMPASVFDGGREAVQARLDDGGAQPTDPLDFTHSDLDPTYPILMGGACALDRDVVLELGGWDQAFFPGVEDNDFALRAVAAGHRMGYSPAMTLAERRRATQAQEFKRAFTGGLMHMKLCAEHDLWQTSPNLHAPEWWQDLLKLPVVAVRMAVSKDKRDLQGLAGRTGLRFGQAAGFLQYRMRRAAITHERGVGLRAE